MAKLRSEDVFIIDSFDIYKFRKKYDISQRELGRILGLGKMTICRYELGATPIKSHRVLLWIIINHYDVFIELAKLAYLRGDISLKRCEQLCKYREVV